MSKSSLASTALIASALLSACSANSNVHDVVGRSGNGPDEIVLAAEKGTVGNALDEGLVLTASQRTSAGIFRVYSAATGELLAISTAEVRLNANGGVDITVDGHTVSFSDADRTADGNGFDREDANGHGASFYIWNADGIDDAFDPNADRYALIIDYYFDASDDTGYSGFAIIGTEALAGTLATLPSATYDGWAQIRFAPTDGFADWDEVEEEVRGDLTLLADFGAGTVSGAITEMNYRAPNNVNPDGIWDPIDGSIGLTETAISGNGFSGTMTADAALTDGFGVSFDDATYSGTFFGPEGQQVAGGINVTGAIDGTPTIGWGVFEAWQN